MLKIDTITDNPRQFRALTGLDKEEFMVLLSFFAPVCDQYYRYHDLKGEKRSLIRYEERQDSSLAGSANKLFFILTYMKENPNQAYHGALFGMSQGKVSLWIQQLCPLLQEALQKMGKLPTRQARALYHQLCCCIETVLLMDVTERRIGRSTDAWVQQQYYSGKKGYHTIKNLLLTTYEGQIYYLGETMEGNQHDKSLYNQAELYFPESLPYLLADLGFLAIQAEDAQIMLPEKKPKAGTLSAWQKSINQWMSSIRVAVEHAIAGVKRYKIIRQQIRLHGWPVRDQIMHIACGLHNLRTCRWTA